MMVTMDRLQNTSNNLTDGQSDSWSSETSILPGQGISGSFEKVINSDVRDPSSNKNTAKKPWNTSCMKATKRWNTSFMTQFKMLTWRSFKQSRGSLLHLYDIIFYTIMAAIYGILYFQMQHSEDSIRDRMGLLFSVLVFWAFEACTKAMLPIPFERGIISKERSAGAYRLSAYYLAKLVSELPLQIIIPTFFYIFVYWMAGLGGVSQFFTTWLLLLLSIATTQSLGLFLAYAFTDFYAGVLCSHVVILTGLMLSGFIIQTLPEWLTWAKYLSVINYPQSSMSIILFGDMENIPCNATSVSTFPQCLSNDTDFIMSTDILEKAGIDIPIYCYISTLILIFTAFRIFAYIALRVRHVVTS